MYRHIEDFTRAWQQESEMTLKVLRALTEPSLAQKMGPEGRTLGFLAWHLVLTLPEMMKHAGVPVVGPAHDAPQPALPEMVREYEASARAIGEGLPGVWTDAMLGELVPMYGQQWPRGMVLTSLIVHQAHHRGQMTALMRLAGLKVPGVYGPAREEWGAYNMPPQP
jgi:uncharacterized damage-inducible protein DinB